MSIGSRTFDAFKMITSEDLADFRGFEIYKVGFTTYPPYLWYVLSMPNALSNVLTLFFGIGFIYLIVKHDINHLVLLLFFLGAYIVHASYTTLAWLNFSPVLPIIALISATWIGEIRNREIARTVASLAIVSSLTVFSIVNWGARGVVIKIAQALSSPVSPKGSCALGSMVFCPSRPNSTDWHMSNILEAIRHDKNACLNKCDLLVIQRGGEFLAGNFKYYMLLDPSLQSKNLTIKQMFIPLWKVSSFDFDLLLNGKFITYITPSRKVTTGALKPYNSIAENFLENPPLSFANAHQTVAVFDVHDGMQIHLTKRIKPLSLVEAEDTLRAIDLDEKYKFQQYAVLAPLYAQTGRFDEALQSYQKALEYEPKNARLYFGLAGVYESLGRLQDAANAYRKVVELAPGTDLAGQAQVWLSVH
jgi:hypothetical protein